MALLLINRSGISYRSVSKVFIAMNITFNLRLRVPTHATVLIWMKKQGIANFREKTDYQNQKWVLIIDESIQFGNKKLLAVLAVPESKLCLGRALTYEDLVPVILKASESWKSQEIKDELLACIDLEQILYAVSDNGNNLKGCYQLMGLKHIEDVGHKFSWIIKETLEKQADFECYTKILSGLRGKLSMSKFAHLVPPNQRIMSRFMNLTPLFNWGYKTLKLLDKNQLNDMEREKVNPILQYKELINQTHFLLGIMNSVQKLLKNKGFSTDTVSECIEKLDKVEDERGKKIVEMIKSYFDDTLKKISKGETVVCSSDIIESSFGKYKSVVKANKSVGVTDLCLCISCLTGSGDLDQIKKAMEGVKIKDIKEWKEKNIGESLLSKRNTIFRKMGCN